MEETTFAILNFKKNIPKLSILDLFKMQKTISQAFFQICNNNFVGFVTTDIFFLLQHIKWWFTHSFFNIIQNLLNKTKWLFSWNLHNTFIFLFLFLKQCSFFKLIWKKCTIKLQLKKKTIVFHWTRQNISKFSNLTTRKLSLTLHQSIRTGRLIWWYWDIAQKRGIYKTAKRCCYARKLWTKRNAHTTMFELAAARVLVDWIARW